MPHTKGMGNCLPSLPQAGTPREMEALHSEADLPSMSSFPAFQIWHARPSMLVLQAPIHACLGEDGSKDALHTIMEILAARILHGFRPSEEVMARMEHRGKEWTCRRGKV